MSCFCAPPTAKESPLQEIQRLDDRNKGKAGMAAASHIASAANGLAGYWPEPATRSGATGH